MKHLNSTFTDEFSCGDRVAVLLPLPLAGAYTYRVGLQAVRAGDFVQVPLGNRSVTGVVWGAPRDQVAEGKLKPISQRLSAPPLSSVTRRFIDWVASYTLSPPGAVLKMAMSVPAALEEVPPQRLYSLADPFPEMRLTPARRQFIEQARSLPPLPMAELLRQTGIGLSVVKGIEQANGLVVTQCHQSSLPLAPESSRPGPILSEGQAAAAETLITALEKGPSVFLIDGVTGSGKTEVYFEVIAKALQSSKQVLVLLPEIALSAQWLSRFQQRFGCEPIVWHSEITPARRRDAWRAVADGSARVVVGARSALFLPFADLGLIIVDEEHEPAYKQEEIVLYHARDMAVVRGRLGEFPVVLASATPSLESWANVQSGRYRLLHLPDRHGGAIMPHIHTIDLRRTPPPKGFWLAPPLVEALTRTLDNGEQGMLFLNRRGYAPLTLCRGCGHRLQCPHCTAWLVEHRQHERLICHHCGHFVTLPPTCPECEAEDSFVPCGPGIERIAEELAHRFPQARMATMASDMISGPAAMAELIEKMSDRQIDLLVGTQMMAKGHHFPWLTLVGVVDADLGLDGGDLRAGERTLQMLSQVAGRAGRSERPGQVFLQTWQPEHPVIQALASGDRDRFLENEAEMRQMAGMPPFGRLIALIVSAPTPELVDSFCRTLSRQAPSQADITVMGPAPAPLSILRGRHRRRFLIQGGKGALLQNPVKHWLANIPLPNGVRIQIDVDPISFM